MANGRCSKHYPKKFNASTVVDEDGYLIYMCQDNGRTVNRNGIDLDNRFVVPHNRQLLMKYDAHINVEWCNQSRSIKYLFKYVHKGHDRVTASFYQSVDKDGNKKEVDEIKIYYDCRYISPCEAAWRIFGFDIHFRDPPVEYLSFHLPDQQSVIFSDYDPIQNVMNHPTIRHSMFTEWMEANKKYEWAKELTYVEFPTKFVWNNSGREWQPRKKGFSIGRMFYVAPGTGELYCLRTLLNIVRGATTYDDIKTVNGVVYSSFRDACYALGLLNDDKEYIDGIMEASQWGTTHSLRNLFATLLTSDSLSRPEYVWSKCWQYLSDDILYRRRSVLDLQLTDNEIQSYALLEIEKILQGRGKSLREFDGMPFPDDVDELVSGNRLIYDELSYDRKKLTEDHKNYVNQLTDEQRYAYDRIIHAVDGDEGGVFFLNGFGGIGKTFVWKTLSAGIRSKGDIVLNVASSDKGVHWQN
ncbi:uncharacterized protein LOC127807714 [Diospyros lotus]|uniref:uncharacterized protein LOC127807714 n=1 Tax=Diospyros lotus TaxID=55363 RepID=UPI00225ADDBE|nr:uncharacterized protein LOC127807714 [Diospyros lotus]